MSITAGAVKELRERTGAGMMECKAALVENDGDLEKAIEYLQIRGVAKAAKKAGRVAAEGLVSAWSSADRATAAMIEVNSETDFVARNQEFVDFTEALAAHVGGAEFDSVEALLQSTMGGSTVEEQRQAKVASIGENITIRRFERATVGTHGVVGAYIHAGGKIGALVVVETSSAVDPAGTFGDAARDVAMHVAAMTPVVVRESEIDEQTVERERRVLTEQAADSGKPAEIVAKMIEGRLTKWKKEICLLHQPFVKDSEQTVGAFIDATAKANGTTASITRFVRFERGEGIEKVESNLAAEVAAFMK